MNITLEVNENARRDDGLAQLILKGEGLENYELDIPFKELAQLITAPDPILLELLVVAGACYAVDKLVDRSLGTDIWTRELSIDLPVGDPKRWSNAQPSLDSALTFLSGDVWNLNFRSSNAKLFKRPARKRRRRAVDPTLPTTIHAVSLFSGGLDSLIGIIDYLEKNPQANLLLIGHYDDQFPGPKTQQETLHRHLKTQYPKRTRLVHVRVTQRPTTSPETSLRARSIIFIALGLYLAASIGPEVPLLAPENGLIALNLPLTASRSGSCSTRTMHPEYLNQLRSAVSALGIGNPIINPLELKTKADCVNECLNPTLLSVVGPKSVSCSHATRRQHWKRKNAGNCGYCVPCLFRRVALDTISADKGSDYGYDVCTDEIGLSSDLESADDLRALVSCVNALRTKPEMRRAIMRVARVEPVDQYVNLVERGLSQIRTWIRQRGSTKLRTESGWAGS